MKNLISANFAGNALLIIFFIFFVFHLLVLFEVIPHHIVWAGKINTPADLVRLETVSLLILLVSALLVAMKMGYVRWLQGSKIINVGVWILFGLFVLNSLANFTAPNPVEKYGFGLVTILIALLCLRLALSPK
jgi:hypothetical protein